MGKESRVEIPEGSGNYYRYEYEAGRTLYKGPVGSAPELSEQEFFDFYGDWKIGENIKLEVEHHDDFDVLQFQLDGPVEPGDLKHQPTGPGMNILDPKKPIFISGRGPVWLHSHLVHEFGHTHIAAGHFDPRLGYVITMSHHPAYKEGDVLQP